MRAFVCLLLVLLRVRTRTIHISLRFTCTKLEIRSIQKHFASSREAFCCWHWGGEEADRFRNGSLIPENRRKKSYIHLPFFVLRRRFYFLLLRARRGSLCSSTFHFERVQLYRVKIHSTSQGRFQSYFADPLEILRKYSNR